MYLPKSELLAFTSHQIHTEFRDRLIAIYFKWERHHGSCLYSFPQDKAPPVTETYYIAFDKHGLQRLQEAHLLGD